MEATAESNTSSQERSWYSPRCLSLVPAISVCTDYILTILLAGSVETILNYEYSPLVRFAVENGIFPLYLTGLAAFYYVAAYHVLRVLRETMLYSGGVAILVLLSLAHVMGGLSWYVRNAWYSNYVVLLTITTMGMAFCIFFLQAWRQAKGAQRGIGALTGSSP